MQSKFSLPCILSWWYTMKLYIFSSALLRQCIQSLHIKQLLNANACPSVQMLLLMSECYWIQVIEEDQYWGACRRLRGTENIVNISWELSIKTPKLNGDNVKSTAWYYKHPKTAKLICRPLFGTNWEYLHCTNASWLKVTSIGAKVQLRIPTWRRLVMCSWGQPACPPDHRFKSDIWADPSSIIILNLSISAEQKRRIMCGNTVTVTFWEIEWRD